MNENSRDKNIMRAIFIVSAVVFLLIVILYNLPKSAEVPAFVKFLPMLNAFINATCSVLLIASLYFIKRKQISIHKRLNILTFILSALFLLSYVTFHSFGIETKFPADN